MRKNFTLFIFFFLLLISGNCIAQLRITPASTAQALAQKLVGDGVSISNVTFTGNLLGGGFFNNISGTNIGLDSGIVLSNGRVKTVGPAVGQLGLDTFGTNLVRQAYTGVDGVTGTSSTGGFANNKWALPGDIDLDLLLLDNETEDAAVLEFDFVPLGDSIKFRYVFSSEEYPEFPCSGVNDAFAFFIQGPGFPVKTNIALIPGTTLPVTIDNINNNPGCGPFPQFFLTNKTNLAFMHNGHTTIFTAKAEVQPCQTYHLKLVIADVGDDEFDSNVFLEAKSLTSNTYSLTNLTQTDASGNSYVVEGCTAGAVKIKRARATPLAEIIHLAYGGTAINTTDVQTMPATITIPANQTEALLNIIPVIDNMPEGIEILKIYTIAECGTGIPTDSTTIQIRDYDILQIAPGMAPDTVFICRNASQQLTATTGYTTYLWDTNSTLDNINSRTPIATPLTAISKYYCTATLGTCNARDSLNLKWKDFTVSKTDVNCAGGSTGQIKVLAGMSNEWQAPLEFWTNNGTHQPDSTFNNLVTGNYAVKVQDASGCTDSISIAVVQAFPDLTNALSSSDPTCLLKGSITVTGGGGKPNYTFSLDGGAFQASNVFEAAAGLHTLEIKDQNGCLKSNTTTLSFTNTVTLSKSADPVICEGLSTPLNITSNAQTFEWTPAATLQNANTILPTASPIVTTKYYVKATTGICERTDSIIVNVNPAPIANAGGPQSTCYGKEVQFHGTGGTEFFWHPGATLTDSMIANPKVLNPVVSRDYFLKVKDANGCFSLKDAMVSLKVVPQVHIYAGPDTSVAIGQPVQLHVSELSNAGVTSYTWSPSYGLSSPVSASPIATLDRDITYFILGKTPENCEGRDTLNIKAYKGPQIYVPNTFTPNGDNLNDVLRPLAFGMKEYHYFRVFNRFGELLFETADFNRGWDGRYKGTLQPTGTFVWIAEAVDYKGKLVQRKGSTILMR